MIKQTAAALVLAGVLAISGSAMGAARLSAQAKISLDRNLPAINFNGIPLRDAIDFLRDVSGANLHVNWKAIEAAGVAPDTAVSLKLRQVSLRKVMGLVLSEAAGGPTLTFYVDDGVIEVTTREIADSVMLTKIYPVQDLLFEPPTIDLPPDFSLNANTEGGANNRGSGRRGSGSGYGGGGNGGGGVGLFGGGGGGGGAVAAPRDKDAKANELVQLIVETVEPTIWVQNGGKASIRFFNGNLIVTAPRSVHEAIGGPVD